MIDFFDFDEKYRVKKKMSPNKFLQGANLTPSEKEKLEKSLLEIEILYDLRSVNGEELVIIGAEVGNFMRYGLKMKELAKAIAQSISYPSVIVLYLGRHAQISLFSTRKNKNDNSRRLIEKTRTSKIFSADEPEYYIFDLLKAIYETDLPLTKAPDKVIEEWMRKIEYDSDDSSKENRYFEYVDDANDIVFENDSDDDFDDYDPDDEKALFEEDDSDEKFRESYVNCLANYSLQLFEEYQSLLAENGLKIYSEDKVYEDGDEVVEIDKDEWIFWYIDTCEDLIEVAFDKMTTNEKKRILKVFLSKKENPTEMVLDISDVRNALFEN